MKYVVSVSGGKDSTACLLYMLDIAPKEDIIPVFCDTKWEADVTYEYLDYLEKELQIDIVRIESEGMVNLALRKKMVPNRQYRFCTYNLKIVPFENWLRENILGKEEFIVVQGLRREESDARANTRTFEIRDSVTKPSFKIPTLYPIAYWKKQEVFDFLESHNIKKNPLYDLGFERVGCMPCVFARKHELMFMPDKYKKRLRELEAAVSKVSKGEGKMFHPNKDKFIDTPLLFSFDDLFGDINV